MPLLRHEKNLITFLLQHLLTGVIGGILFGGLLLYFDVSHLRTMAMDEDNGILTLCLMFFGLMVTFGSLAMAAAIMSQAQDRN
jgi:hypothetical protein